MGVTSSVVEKVVSGVASGISGDSSQWWEDGYNIAYDLNLSRYMRAGKRALLGQSLIETRSTEALVLQGDGTYRPRRGPITNYIPSSRAALGASSNPTPVPDTGGVSPIFGTAGGFKWAAGTNIDKRQENRAIPQIIGMLAYSFVVTPHGLGAQVRDVEGTGVNGVDREGFTYDIDTKTTLTGRAPAFIIEEPGNSQRLVYLFENDGSGNLAVSIFHPFGDPIKDNVTIDQVQFNYGAFIPPYIITDGSEVTIDPELAIGHGVGGQFSQAVINYAAGSDMTGAVAGVPGVYPTGWTGLESSSGVYREIVGVGERNGLPTIQLRFYGQWDVGHPGYTNVSLGALSAMPVTESGKISQGMHIALVAGSLGPVSSMNLNAYFRLVDVYKGQTSAYIKNSITSEFKPVGAVDDTLSPIGGSCDAAEMALFFHVDPETPFDFTLEIGAPYLSPVGFVPPVNIGPGTTATRAADNPVVVQGYGEELITGDRDDFTVSTDYESATVTADQLGDADLVDLPGVNSRTLFRPVVPLVADVKARWEIQLRSVTGEGTWPLAAYDGTDRVSEQLVSLTEDWSTHYIEMTITDPAGLPGIYLGDRRDVVGETLFQAYVKQGSIKQVLPYPGYNITGIVSGHERVEGGGFDGVLDAAWVPGGAGVYTVETEAGALKVIGNAYASQQIATTAGRVQRFSAAILEAQGSSNEIRVGNSPGAFEVARSATTLDVGSHELFWLAPDNFSYVALKTHYAGSSLDETLFDNASNQEVDPGVVFEVKAKWGATIGQHAFRFDEGASANIILAQQTGLGTIKLLVRVAGVDVINFASAVLWPSDTEATFRLEITKTDAGTFFALFLDGVYIDDIPAGPVDYPDAINQLKLAPVEGVSVIKQVHGK